MSIVVPVCIAIAAVLLFSIRRSPRPREIVRSLSLAERQFIAEQLEPITKLPLNTTEDEQTWYAATRETMQRLRSRFPDVASVVPHELYHYFHDADIHRREPSYRSRQEQLILEFIRELREPQKT